METRNPKPKPHIAIAFGRSQISSGAATAVDFGLLFGLTEGFHVWYVLSVALGALAGAIANFLINRYWSFEAQDGRWGPQATRYALISTGSLVLNTFGVWALTEFGKVHYAVSVVLVAVAVGVIFNFPLHRHYVFK